MFPISRIFYFIWNFAFHCELVYNIHSIRFNYGSSIHSFGKLSCLSKTLLLALRARFIKSTLQLNAQAMVPIIGQILNSNKSNKVCFVMYHEGCRINILPRIGVQKCKSLYLLTQFLATWNCYRFVNRI